MLLPSNYCIELSAVARRHERQAAAQGGAPAAAHACVRALARLPGVPVVRFRVACSLLAMLLVGGMSPALGQDEGAPGSSWHHYALADHWSTEAGDSLIIDSLGSVRFVDRHGTLLDTAHVAIECWKPASSPGLQLVSVIVLAFSMGDTVSTLPGVFVAGEGDRASLCLIGVGSPLKWRLWKWFALGELKELCFEGTQP
jgi:hypothetical protein